MRLSWVVIGLLAAGCGSGIDKKGPELAENRTPNVAPGPNNTTGGTQNNTVVATNNTIAPPNNVNNTTPVNNRDWSTCYTDEDGDGFGIDEQMIDAPCADVGLVSEPGDCDDTDAQINPNGVDVCDSVDRNCDDRWAASVPAVCPTIQAALDAAAMTGNGGDIEVAAGTYVENIVFGGAAVRLIGAGPTSTTIDGSGGDTAAVRFTDSEGPESVLEGFSITGGSGYLSGDSVRGGGIYISDADPTLRNLVIRNNRAPGDSGYGGGISISLSSALIEQVDIVGNRAGYYGGGMYVSQSEPTFRQVRLIDNESIYGGGAAIYFSNALFESVIVAANRASFGGGVLVQGDDPAFDHVALVGNQADEGGAVKLLSSSTPLFENTTFNANTAALGGAIHNESGSPVVQYCNFTENGGSPLVGIDLGSFAGNIQQPPRFVSTQGDPRTWNLHLQPTSALIDAGDPNAVDFDGTRADIGAYGGQYGDW